MQPKSAVQLLGEYAENGAEAAFSELALRHTNLVYSAASRQVELTAAASEISQNVFLGLARQVGLISARLAPEASLAGFAQCPQSFTQRFEVTWSLASTGGRVGVIPPVVP